MSSPESKPKDSQQSIKSSPPIKQRSISEPDLVGTTAHQNTALWPGRSGGFPAGLTVDQLYRFRRKQRPPGVAEDNLQLTVGSLAAIKTEYCRQFRAPSLEALSVKRAPHQDDSIADIVLRAEDRLFDQTESRCQFRQHEGFDFAEMFRRPANLKLEGQMITDTEQSRSYITHDVMADRAKLCRIDTNLKPSGPVEGHSEQKDMYKRHDELPRRRCLKKRATNLHLEGDLLVDTEHRMEYVPYDLQNFLSRDPLQKPVNNLKLEGSQSIHPEYKDTYVPKNGIKSEIRLPQPNLKVEGDFKLAPEYSDSFIQFPFQHSDKQKGRVDSLKMEGTMTISAEYKDTLGKNIGKVEDTKPGTSLKLEGDLNSMSQYKENFIPKNGERSEPSKPKPNLQMGGIFSSSPEYKDQYRQYPIEKSSMIRKPNNINLEGRIYMNPEYTCQYKKPLLTRRPSPLKGTHNLHLEGEMSHSPEYKASYSNFGRQKPTSRRHRGSTVSDEIKTLNDLQGNFECQPEYRKAKMDLLIRERPPTRKGLDKEMPVAPPKIRSPLPKTSRAPSRSVSPSYRLYVSPPSLNGNSGKQTPKKETRHRRKSQSPEIKSLKTETKQFDNSPAFIVLDEPKDFRSKTNINMCQKNANWMPPWYDTNIQR